MNGDEASLQLVAKETEAALQAAAGRREIRGSQLPELEEHPQWSTLSRLPLRVTVGVPLPRFKVRDLLALAAGQFCLSAWSSTTDVPVEVGSAQLSWAEFEVVEQRMAVRLTRLA